MLHTPPSEGLDPRHLWVIALPLYGSLCQRWGSGPHLCPSCPPLTAAFCPQLCKSHCTVFGLFWVSCMLCSCIIGMSVGKVSSAPPYSAISPRFQGVQWGCLPVVLVFALELWLGTHCRVARGHHIRLNRCSWSCVLPRARCPPVDSKSYQELLLIGKLMAPSTFCQSSMGF